MEQIKILVVDDSAFMRKSISIMLESDPGIKVIAIARDGEEGYKLAKSLLPDLITLDIEMPKMDGLTALKKIMADCPTSVIMLSSLTTEGAEVTLKALEYGAVDFIPKELSYVNVNIVKIKDELINKVKEIVKQRKMQNMLRRIQKVGSEVPVAKPKTSEVQFTHEMLKVNFRAIALGISTGGPFSLQKVIPKISGKLKVPIFIVQHMPPKFTKSLAERLNTLSQVEVKEAENNELVRKGVIYIAQGGYHMLVERSVGGNEVIKISSEPSSMLHCPSVDVMVESVVDTYGKDVLGIIMTGMGKDGFEGIKKLKKIGGHTIAQDEESCVVYGMPRAIVEGGVADIVAPLDKISELINKVI